MVWQISLLNFLCALPQPGHAWGFGDGLPGWALPTTRSLKQKSTRISDIIADKYKWLSATQFINEWHTLDGMPNRMAISRLDQVWAPQIPINDSNLIPDLQGPFPFQQPDPNERKPGRCLLMLGDACRQWWASPMLPIKPPPLGSTACPGNCNNGIGICNLDIGTCNCPAGWTGEGCMKPDPRPCTDRNRSPEDPDEPTSSLNEFGEDKDWLQGGWKASRCGGWCDTTIGLCFCGLNSTHRRIPAPPGSPPGTPPIQEGRPLFNPCQPKQDAQGRGTRWGSVDFSTLYGPRGWCNAELGDTLNTCPCALEGVAGAGCEKRNAVVCPNQCNLRGHCDLGWCRCDPGWYGTSCDRRVPNFAAPDESMLTNQRRQMFKGVWQEPIHSRKVQEGKPVRKQPFIYVYDLPSEFNTRLLQYQHTEGACNWRRFAEANGTFLEPGAYSVEAYLHETLLISKHRTMDASEADFFYVPIYLTCYMSPVLGMADHPWFAAPVTYPRPMQAAAMYQAVYDWICVKYPFWNRTGGRDHIWTAVHDEGACYMPTTIYNTSIFLTHWGRADLVHQSGTAWAADNYNTPTPPGWEKKFPKDWREAYKGHACYTPGKDILIPAFQTPTQFQYSPLLGYQPLKRDLLCYFRGDMGLHREWWWYSRGVRQTLFRLANEDKWAEKYRIIIGSVDTVKGEYGLGLSRAIFCPVLMGDGWSARSEFAILHGCLPVLMNDNVMPVWHDVVDWSQFSLRIPQARIAELPQILLAVNQSTIAKMQLALSKVWSRFAYATGPYHRSELPNFSRMNHQPALNISASHPYKPLKRFPVRHDALHTLLQVLHGRMKEIHSHRLAPA